MYLLAVVLVEQEKLEPLLSAFKEIGVSGATILDSIGVGPGSMNLSKNPFIARLQKLISEDKTMHTTLFSVIENADKLSQAVAAAKQIVGNFSSPGKGLLFTMPLLSVEGLKKNQTA